MDATGEALLATLTKQRQHVLGILDGLDEADLRRPVLPTGWCCIGLVQHLALDVERFWFRAVLANEAAAWASLAEHEESAWQVSASTSANEVLALYRDEIERADTIIRATPIDAPPGRWPTEIFPNFRMADLRQMLLHVITETSCHAGHLDAARELIDGHTWMTL